MVKIENISSEYYIIFNKRDKCIAPTKIQTSLQINFMMKLKYIKGSEKYSFMHFMLFSDSK